MRISDWSSDVCSSDLDAVVEAVDEGRDLFVGGLRGHADEMRARRQFTSIARKGPSLMIAPARRKRLDPGHGQGRSARPDYACPRPPRAPSSEEHTSELQSPMRISYAVFCLKTTTYSLDY